MSKTVKILCLVSLALVAVSVAICQFVPQYEFSLIPKPEESSSHGGFTIVGYDPVYDPIVEKWWAIVEFVLIVAVAFAFAAVKIWYQDRSEKNETLKEHFAHSRIIIIEGKNENQS